MDQEIQQEFWHLRERITRLETQREYDVQLHQLRSQLPATTHTFGLTLGIKEFAKLALAVLLPLLVLIATGDKQQARTAAQTMLMP